jgi:hypothetical protein
MISRYFPFYALGFRCNPFRALTNAEWGEAAILPESVASIITGGFTHLQILGATGSGKTSTLLGLTARFTQAGRRAGYEYLPNGQHRFGTNVRGLEILLLDEAQRLSPRERDRLLATVAKGSAGNLRLVLSSHEDLTPLFTQCALPLATVSYDAITEEHLRAVITRRLAYFALTSDVPSVTVTPDALSYLWQTYGVNLRAVEHLLYEVFQRLQRTGLITVEQLQTVAVLISHHAKP